MDSRNDDPIVISDSEEEVPKTPPTPPIPPASPQGGVGVMEAMGGVGRMGRVSTVTPLPKVEPVNTATEPPYQQFFGHTPMYVPPSPTYFPTTPDHPPPWSGSGFCSPDPRRESTPPTPRHLQVLKGQLTNETKVKILPTISTLLGNMKLIIGKLEHQADFLSNSLQLRNTQSVLLYLQHLETTIQEARAVWKSFTGQHANNFNDMLCRVAMTRTSTEFWSELSKVQEALKLLEDTSRLEVQNMREVLQPEKEYFDHHDLGTLTGLWNSFTPPVFEFIQTYKTFAEFLANFVMVDN